IEGAVPPECELMLRGPESATWFSSRRPPIVRGVVAGRARFGPLVPATYSLRWRRDGRFSPIVRAVAVEESSTSVHLTAPTPRDLRMSLAGWTRLIDHLGGLAARVVVD